MAKRLVVLVSGNGSNLQAILDACAAGTLAAQVACVICNKADAFALKRAQAAGVKVEVLPNQKDRQAYDRHLAQVTASYAPDLIVLAGWMRVLTMEFLGQFPEKVINLHPATDPRFAGINAIERSFDAWQQGSLAAGGVMVHLVPDEGVDNGPVIASAAVPFMDNDSLDTYAARTHAVEHKLIVEAIETCLSAT